MDYDPTIVSYEQLLSAFWAGHNPTYPSYSRQYRSAIFYTTEQQQKLANESKQAEEARLGKTIHTDIELDTGFYIAEDYHQKFYLRQRSEIVNTLYAVYPDPANFRDSTAAARLNGYVGGYGDEETLKRNLDRLGLSESGRRTLLQIAESGLKSGCQAVIPQD